MATRDIAVSDTPQPFGRWRCAVGLFIAAKARMRIRQ